MHFAALEINLRHFETPLENKHRGVKHVSIDFAGVHTATREIIGWYRVCGVFQFYDNDSGHDGTGGSRCNSICKKLLLLVFSCVDVANEKTSSTIYRRLSTFNALVFMVYTWIQAPRYKIHFNVAERREPMNFTQCGFLTT